ncbi:hypothetical protein FKW77_008320 [Venturia effusa]|uniref:Glycosyl transferase CAP10 domain-containing protein n=1 Tax=Venturia effusa TaxID=50376 RepID=A0A517L1T0_9PEZI|nr:hypothetical protein FKW77_008320 [Venturia effusa]
MTDMSALCDAVRPLVGTWRNPSSKTKCILIAIFVTITLSYSLLYTGSFDRIREVRLPHRRPSPPKEEEVPKASHHPIDDLILKARAQYTEILGKQSYDLTSAARQYRKRRGRHPPPGFDRWFAYALSQDAIVVEDFFDRIYDDLAPYWAIDPKVLRYQSDAHDFKIVVRNGNATYTDDGSPGRVPWMQLWHGLVQEMQDELPDVDVPVNVMDESRLLVPWEEINRYMNNSRPSGALIPADEVVVNFTGLATFDADANRTDGLEPYDPQWKGAPYWDMVRDACPPDSPGRNTTTLTDLKTPTLFPEGYPKHSYQGYVSNWTASKDSCYQPHLRGLHGTFIEPISIKTSTKFIPLFGGSKLSVNNEILLPPATYLNPDPLYAGGQDHGPAWEKKKPGVVWRGVASGGRSRPETWRHFQRHRFVQMLNGTAVLKAETTRIRGETFDLPDWKHYNLKAPRNGYLGDWLSSFSDVAFIDMLCFPANGRKDCDHTNDWFQVKDGFPMEEMYKHKYLPDVDGNSFSGRYRGFLRSTSLPIKATIYNEWHDSRLFPWIHFVPMDNTFIDIYGILDYFIGYEGHGSHDDMAQMIALEGKKWMELVGRRVDMKIYVWRLLLEWARICDDNRQKLGWAGDMMEGFIENVDEMDGM